MPLADEYAGLLRIARAAWADQFLYLLLLYAILTGRSRLQRLSPALRWTCAALGAALLAWGVLGAIDPVYGNPMQRMAFYALLLVCAPPSRRWRATLLLCLAIDLSFQFLFATKTIAFGAPHMMLWDDPFSETLIHTYLSAFSYPLLWLMQELGLREASRFATTAIDAISVNGALVLYPLVVGFSWVMARFVWRLLYERPAFPTDADPAEPDAAAPRTPVRDLLAALALLLAQAGLLTLAAHSALLFHTKLLLLVEILLPALFAGITARSPRKIPLRAALFYLLHGLIPLILPDRVAFAMTSAACFLALGLLGYSFVGIAARDRHDRWSWWKAMLLFFLALAAPPLVFGYAALGLLAEVSDLRLILAQASKPACPTRDRMNRARLPGLTAALAAWVVGFAPMGLAEWAAADHVEAAARRLPAPVAWVQPLPADPWGFVDSYCGGLHKRPCRPQEVATEDAKEICDESPCRVVRFACADTRFCPAEPWWPGTHASLTPMRDAWTGRRILATEQSWYAHMKDTYGTMPRHFVAPENIEVLRQLGYGMAVFCCEDAPR